MQLQEEMVIVKWYLEVMESGIDTKQIVKEHVKLKQEHAIVKEQASIDISNLNQENKKLTK